MLLFVLLKGYFFAEAKEEARLLLEEVRRAVVSFCAARR
jgi:hypothetical protein